MENALIKARHAATISGLPAIADDTGLVVPALGGALGLYSAQVTPEGFGMKQRLKTGKIISGIS